MFAAESALLKARGHRVEQYTVHNNQIKGRGSIALAAGTVWNRESARDLRRFFRTSGAEVAHFHNTLPLISPAGLYAARSEGLAVVQTLHNYRLMCPAGTFFRDGRVCEECLQRSVPWPAVLYGCYRQSRVATAVVTAMLTVHRVVGTWWREVDVYVAITDFAKTKFVEGGLPPDRIVVKPNIISLDTGPGTGAGGYALFVGRLSPEKGITTLIEAWQRFQPSCSLRIAGDGPLAETVAYAAKHRADVEWMGWQPRDRILTLLKDAAFLIVPSVWYEAGQPLVVAEAFAAGLPVIASALGSLNSVIDHGRTGRLFRPGDAEDLAAQVAWMSHHPADLARMRRAARAEYEAQYTEDQNYAMLMDIYRRAITTAAAR